MVVKLKLFLAFLPLILSAAANPEASSVLVIVNDATVAETGTSGVGASQFVANRYIAARGIPAANVVHISAKGCCGFADGTSPALYNNYHVSPEQFTSDIAGPIKTYLESHNLKQQIKYIVPTYGVPTHIGQLPPFAQLSVDSFLSQMYLTGLTAFTTNPAYNAVPTSTPAHWTNVGRTLPVYLVARLDGPSAVIAAGLVDKAVAAEKGIAKSSGTGYFDFQGNSDPTDQTMLNAYNLCVAGGFTCVLNNQSVTRHLIQSAPNTLWAWGWYGGPGPGTVYSFVPGAVGAQLVSDSAYDIRELISSEPAWVARYLIDGVTGTWGSTGEPYAGNFPKGDNLLNHLWNGYTFGEAAYIAAPVLGWMIVFVGDPLYKPVFGAATEPPPTSVLPMTITLTIGVDGSVTVK